VKHHRRNNARAAKHLPEPYDWYCENEWPVEALLRYVAFEGLVYDPACGRGNIPRVFAAAGFETHASDLVDRGLEGAHQLDFLAAASAAFRVPNVVTNPPYSYVDGIAEAFARRAIEIATRRVALLVPLKWLASIGRWRLFTEHPPEQILVLSERPSMPPGSKIAALGRRAFKGGTQDFVWVVWNTAAPAAPGYTRTVWIEPRAESVRRPRRP
jgi:hypothetical protein